MAQETWLTEKQIPQMQELGVQFFARSGMEQAVSAGVLKGRPFGGVSICWSEDLNHIVTPLTEYKHERVVALNMKLVTGNIIFISVYMPFLDSRNRTKCQTEAYKAIAEIETIITDHPQHTFVIGGDLNTELRGTSPFDTLWNNFATKYHFAFCSHLFNSPGFTYHHETLGQRKFNDHFLISQKLSDEGWCKNHKILEDGENPSDHLPITMSMAVEVQRYYEDVNVRKESPMLKWSKVNAQYKLAYTERLDNSLLTRGPHHGAMPCEAICHCELSECKDSLQREYEEIVDCLRDADSGLPRHRKGREKGWWTRELSELKSQSVDIEKLWLAEGRPDHGPTQRERLRVRAAYRREIRSAQKAPKQKAWNRLHSALEVCDTTNFWNSWKSLHSKNSSRCAPVVEGCSSKEAIAEVFRKSFASNSEPNNKTKVESLNLDFAEKYTEFSQKHLTDCNCATYSVSLKTVMDAVCAMKSGKCADADGLSAEHFHNAPLSLLKRLKTLFNQMLKHSFVPSAFKFGFMIPLVKDTQGNHSDVANYRGITISPIISKIFEHTLKIIFADHLSTSTLQFGFKSKSSTSHALFCLRQTVDYYINNGSRVYCSFLDASKAFDRLVHSGLFLKLMARNVPKVFLDIVISWHDGLFCQVRWDNHYSEWFPVTAGVRQGGVLSPVLYSIYVDDLIYILQQSGIGCHFLKTFAAALFYADDMAVLAPSIKGLQRLLDLCHAYCVKWDIKLNAKKSKNLFFGKGLTPTFTLELNGENIPWEAKWDYLGVTLSSSKSFNCCVKAKVAKFYGSLNSILRIEGHSDEMVLFRLLEAHCLSILLFGIEVIHVKNPDDRRQLRVAYNAIYRKTFDYSHRESVEDLQHALGRSTWEELLKERRSLFLEKCGAWPKDSLVRALSSTATL